MIRRQALVVGLGQFGMSLARSLSSRQVEVLALDRDEKRVQVAASFVAEAAQIDATQADALIRTSPERRDVCICAIGDEAREASIICTTLLRQMGARRVIARASDPLHARILTLIGADQIVNPEAEFGDRFANQILHEKIKGEMPLGAGVLITEASIPQSFINQSLGELQLPRRYGITVVAVRHGHSGDVTLPSVETRLQEGDELIVVAREGAVSRMLEKG